MAVPRRSARHCGGGGGGGGCEFFSAMTSSWKSWIVLLMGICSVGLDRNGVRRTGGGGGESGWFSLSLGPQLYGAYAQNPASSADEAFIPTRTVHDFVQNTVLAPNHLAPETIDRGAMFVNIKSIHMARAENSSSSGYFSLWFTPFLPNIWTNIPSDEDTFKRGEIWRFDLSTPALSHVAGTRYLQGYVEGEGEKAVFNLPSSLALSADGNTLYVLDNYNDMVRTVDLSRNTNQTGVFFQLQGNASVPTISTTNYHQQGASNMTLERRGQVLNMYSRMAFDPVEGMFYLTTNQSVLVINANTKSINRTYNIPLIDMVGIALSQDASWLFVADHAGDGIAGKLHIVNLTAGRGEGGGGGVGGEIVSLGRDVFGLSFQPWGLALTSEGSHLFIGDLAMQSVRLVRLSADRRSIVNMTDVVENANQPECIALARNESTLLVGNQMYRDHQLFVGEINKTALLAFGENSTLSPSPTPAPAPSLSPSPTPAPSLSVPSGGPFPTVHGKSAETDSSAVDASSSKSSCSPSLLSLLHVNLAVASLAFYLSLLISSSPFS